MQESNPKDFASYLSRERIAFVQNNKKAGGTKKKGTKKKAAKKKKK